MADTDREARILELRRQIESGEYQIDNQRLAARLIDEHLSDRDVSEDESRVKARGTSSS
jgi:hypothetical protein